MLNIKYQIYDDIVIALSYNLYSFP